MATVALAKEGYYPQSSSVYYVSDSNNRIFFAASSESRKIQNILSNSAVSLVITDEINSTSLQIEGIGSVIADPRQNTNLLIDLYKIIGTQNPEEFIWPIISLHSPNIVVVQVDITWFKYSNFTTKNCFEGTGRDL